MNKRRLHKAKARREATRRGQSVRLLKFSELRDQPTFYASDAAVHEAVQRVMVKHRASLERLAR